MRGEAALVHVASLLVAVVALAGCREDRPRPDPARATPTSPVASPAAPAATPSAPPSTSDATTIATDGGRTKGEEGTIGPSLSDFAAIRDKAITPAMRECKVDTDCVVISSTCGRAAVATVASSAALGALDTVCPSKASGMQGLLGAAPPPPAKCAAGKCVVD